MKANNAKERCYECEVLKNHEQQNKSFLFGFFCPIANKYVVRDDISCEWIVSDNMIF